MDMRERFRGCLLGLAAGDALGTTFEFRQPGSFEAIQDMVGGGPFQLNAGEWDEMRADVRVGGLDEGQTQRIPRSLHDTPIACAII
jgi:hypothetical protein